MLGELKECVVEEKLGKEHGSSADTMNPLLCIDIQMSESFLGAKGMPRPSVDTPKTFRVTLIKSVAR